MEVKHSPEENERRGRIRELLLPSNIRSMGTIQELFEGIMAEFMKNELEAELDNELVYSMYDHKNKDTLKSRNKHSVVLIRQK